LKEQTITLKIGVFNLTWDTNIRGTSIDLPTVNVGVTVPDRYGFEWNAYTGYWELISITEGVL
jgi:hypothetical protein